MNDNVRALIEKLASEHHLSCAEYIELLSSREAEAAELLAEKARAVAGAVYGREVFLRGLIEFSNYCKNDCYYCGIRRSNRLAARYRLSPEEIFSCCDEGYRLGYRTFVLQSGEDPFFSDKVLVPLIAAIKESYPEVAVTLSLGERSYESYKALRTAGADRYLLRHETATPAHYAKLHPAEMSLKTRLNCLNYLRELGYAVGVGFMVGSPFQTVENIVADLQFIEEFQPDMCGIGPFIPHAATPFAGERAGSVELTCYLLSIIRLIIPDILLPATTALGTLAEDGREKGILSGANVLMPNLSPVSVRKKYELYDGKICTGEESAQCRLCLSGRIKSIGYKVVCSRGDRRKIESLIPPDEQKFLNCDKKQAASRLGEERP